MIVRSALVAIVSLWHLLVIFLPKITRYFASFTKRMFRHFNGIRTSTGRRRWE
jgi:hypothetical protein